jgi:hypothetical protein
MLCAPVRKQNLFLGEAIYTLVLLKT